MINKAIIFAAILTITGCATDGMNAFYQDTGRTFAVMKMIDNSSNPTAKAKEIQDNLNKVISFVEENKVTDSSIVETKLKEYFFQKDMEPSDRFLAIKMVEGFMINVNQYFNEFPDITQDERVSKIVEFLKKIKEDTRFYTG